MARRDVALGLLAALVLAIGVAAQGAELHVPRDFASLQQAVDAAQEGDVILIAEGTYSAFEVNNKKNITIRGFVDEPELVVINGTVRINNTVGLLVEGLTFTGSGDGISVTGENEGLVVSHSHLVRNRISGITFARTAIYEGTEIRYCEITYNGHDGIVLGGSGQNVLVFRCNISHNGQTTATGVGIRVDKDVKDVVISENVIVGNPFAGIHPY